MTMPTAPEHSQGLIHQQIEAAAKTLAEVMDYPWEHMPEQGRANMRKNAMRILEAALTQTGGWQPICEAPLDETPVDIWRPSWGGERCVNMKRVDLGGGNVFYDPVDAGPCCVRDATHFMHIPSSPAAEREVGA